MIKVYIEYSELYYNCYDVDENDLFDNCPPGFELQLVGCFENVDQVTDLILNDAVPENHIGDRSKFFQYEFGKNYIRSSKLMINNIVDIVGIDTEYEDFKEKLKNKIIEIYDRQRVEYFEIVEEAERQKKLRKQTSAEAAKEKRRKKFEKLKEEFGNE